MVEIYGLSEGKEAVHVADDGSKIRIFNHLSHRINVKTIELDNRRDHEIQIHVLK